MRKLVKTIVAILAAITLPIIYFIFKSRKDPLIDAAERNESRAKTTRNEIREFERDIRKRASSDSRKTLEQLVQEDNARRAGLERGKE